MRVDFVRGERERKGRAFDIMRTVDTARARIETEKNKMESE